MSGGVGVNLRVTGHCNQGGRKYMEDMFSVAYQQTADLKDLEYAFFGIFDGHGGPEAATYAKEHLLDSIVSQKAFWSDRDEDVLRAIREGYMSTHYTMWKDRDKWPTNSSGLPSTSGTTATIAFIMKSKIYIGHVGDSGIVLGFQEGTDPTWQAKLLTRDHKPESFTEKRRIHLCGGKVISKAGVPRVVWNRPKIGHRGPVRRSTPIDEIPFLAVSRSLGDFWSYNSEYDKFVVSPEPDVSVFPVDPQKHRCLIFGTDGLWNVMNPSYAVQTVQWTEIQNEKHVINQTQNQNHPEWINPSKNLVDEALFLWSVKNLRADNTSVVTLMLDPPGPPRAQVLMSQLKRNCSANEKPLSSTPLEAGSKLCGSKGSMSPQTSNDIPLEMGEENLPAVPASGSVALFTHYGSNQYSLPWSMNKSSAPMSSPKEDLDASIIDHERLLSNSPDKSSNRNSDSSQSGTCTSNIVDESHRNLVQINEISSSSTSENRNSDNDEKCVFANNIIQKFKRKPNICSETSHCMNNTSTLPKKKRSSEGVRDDEKAGSNSDVENERDNWQSTSASTSNSMKRRKSKKSSSDWNRTSHSIMSPLPNTGKMSSMKKPVRSIETTTRTLRSDTSAATPVKTLRSRNVDLSLCNKQQSDFSMPVKCSRNVDLSSSKLAVLPRTGVFSRTSENVHCLGSSPILKRSASMSPTPHILANKYGKQSNSLSPPAKRFSKDVSNSRQCMKTRSHVSRRFIK